MLSIALVVLVGCAPQDTTLGNGNDQNDVVTGTGRMQLDPEALTIQDIEVGYSKSGDFTITSVGDADFILSEAKIVADASDVFYFDEVEDVRLAPGQSATYTVVADLDEATAADGQLRLKTNDPDASTYLLDLHAWPLGYVPPEDTGGGDSGGDSGGAP
jgi:hypothetical protein